MFEAIILDLKNGGTLETSEWMLVCYVILITIIMCVFTGFSIRNGIKQRKFKLKDKLLVPFWLGWISFLIVESVPKRIGVGFGKNSRFDVFLSESPIAMAIFPIVAFIYVLASAFAILLPWIILIYELKRYKRET